MKCSKCGAEIKNDALYCPACGQEIQWVPDYSTIETLMHQQKTNRASEVKEKAKKSQTEEPPAVPETKKKPISKTTAVFIICILSLVIVAFIINRKNYNSFDYQLAQAETAFSNNDYNQALNYVDRALSLKRDSTEANLLMAQIFTAQGDTGTALPILLTAIKNNPTSVDAYGQLLRLYESLGKFEEIEELMKSCSDPKLLEKYAAYVCKPPMVSLKSGSYARKQTLDLTPANEKDVIYYTLDGSIPTNKSKLYESQLTLGEGITNFNAISINEKGIASENVSETYTISLKGPETPKISPSSGEFQQSMEIKIVNIPDGCTAYYEFDGTPTTSSKKYRGAVTMPEGEHIFSVILVDENGKSSNVASATYVLYSS